jgi:hypothetical protein
MNLINIFLREKVRFIQTTVENGMAEFFGNQKSEMLSLQGCQF